jgi:hypothetical protein
LNTAQQRADIGGISLNEREGTSSGDEGIPSEDEDTELASREERTGVLHLVHSWYPLGHNVSNLKSIFSFLATESFPGEDGSLC